jgi:hypothetical protein
MGNLRVVFSAACTVASLAALGCDDGTVCYAMCVSATQAGGFDAVQMCFEDLGGQAACTEKIGGECSGTVIGEGDIEGEPVFDDDCHSCDDDCVDYPEFTP